MQTIILFDSICNLCNGFVQFVIKRDKKDQFRFASLQSAYGRHLLQQQNMQLTSLVVVHDKKVLCESNAALLIFEHLGWPWRAVILFRIIPKFMRDALYRLIARNRYRLFGKQTSCWVPSEELKAKFIE